MGFSKELRKLREAQGLSVEDAAEKVSMGARAYRDRENDRANINFAEELGLLVALGMGPQRAMEVASEPDVISVGGSEGLEKMRNMLQQNRDDPFVRETGDAFILSIRNHECEEYDVSKDEVKRPEHILSWVAHLTEKVWVTNEHINLFVTLASSYLGVKLHGTD